MFDESGFKELLSALKAVEKNINKINQDFLVMMAKHTMVRAVNRTPVDTGFLKSQWSITPPEGLEITVMNSAEYAQPVETGRVIKSKKGKYWYPGIFMLQRAMDETNTELPNAYQKYLKKKLKDIL